MQWIIDVPPFKASLLGRAANGLRMPRTLFGGYPRVGGT
jgi:hypothetical protein